MEGLGATAIAIVVLVAGFGLFALSQDRHWQAVCGSAALSRHRSLGLRAIAFVLLVVALLVLILVEGPAFGPLLWGVLLSVAALLMVFITNRHLRWLRPLARLVLAVRWTSGRSPE